MTRAAISDLCSNGRREIPTLSFTRTTGDALGYTWFSREVLDTEPNAYAAKGSPAGANTQDRISPRLNLFQKVGRAEVQRPRVKPPSSASPDY